MSAITSGIKGFVTQEPSVLIGLGLTGLLALQNQIGSGVIPDNWQGIGAAIAGLVIRFAVVPVAKHNSHVASAFHAGETHAKRAAKKTAKKK